MLRHFRLAAARPLDMRQNNAGSFRRNLNLSTDLGRCDDRQALEQAGVCFDGIKERTLSSIYRTIVVIGFVSLIAGPLRLLSIFLAALASDWRLATGLRAQKFAAH